MYFMYTPVPLWLALLVWIVPLSVARQAGKWARAQARAAAGWPPNEGCANKNSLYKIQYIIKRVH
jgi:hypothetical protein